MEKVISAKPDILKIGVLIGKEFEPQWLREVILRLSTSPNISVDRLFIKSRPLRKVGFLFNLFTKINQLFTPVPDKYLLPSKSLVSQSAVPDENHFHILFDPAIVEFNALSYPEFGLVRPVFGKSGSDHRFAGLIDWYDDSPVTGFGLVYKTAPHDPGQLLLKHSVRTERKSFVKNRIAVQSRAIDSICDFFNKLSIDRDLIKKHLGAPEQAVPPPNFIALMFKFFFRIGGLILNKILYFDRWVLLIGENSDDINLSQLKIIHPPQDRFWADPFIVRSQNTISIFAEEFPFNTRKGVLSCSEYTPTGDLLPFKTILQKDCHLSYPNIFQHNGTWYMIPETAENKTVDLYESMNFPYEWKFKKNLISDIAAFDATVYFDKDLVWLFCTVQRNEFGSPNDDLYIFYSDDLLNGIWHSHKMNPVISDPAKARPAGNFFVKDGQLYRPAQICVPVYGYGVNINKVTCLTTENYVEETVKTIKPDADGKFLGIHSYNFSEDLLVMDAILRKNRIRNLWPLS